jgi:hypothetical protein
MVLKSPKTKNASHLLMVGGYCDSPILQRAVKDAFQSKLKVLIPEFASLCVLRGAVLYGHRPQTFTCRIASKTYGLEMWELYDPQKHGDSTKDTIQTEKGLYRTDVFRVLVKKGQTMNLGDVKEFVFPVCNANESAIAFNIYCSETSEPAKYLSDEKVELDGHWEMPLTGLGLDRLVRFKVSFSTTEITLKTQQSQNGVDSEWMVHAFDFLTNESSMSSNE